MKFRKIGLISMLFTLAIYSDLYGEPLNELFTDIPNFSVLQIEQDQAKHNLAIIRSRYVQVKTDYLAGESFSRGAERIALNLFKDVSLTAIKDRLERRSTDCYTWFGHIEREGYSHVILVVENGGMAGNIMFEGATYQIRDLGDGVHAIYEIDPSAFPEDAPPIIPQGEMKDISDDTPPTAMSDDGSLIDVMVVYSQDAASYVSNIASEIQIAIDLTNQTYANSNINQRVRLVHSAQVTYTETGDPLTDLQRLRYPSDGYIDDVHLMRNTYGADIVSLWVKSLGVDTCGRAYVMTDSRLSNSFEKSAFNVISVDEEEISCSIYTFTHEMGHNMGCHHDRYVCDEDDKGAYDYSHGYVSILGEFRTIMAYWRECDDKGFYCERIPFWSNPNVTYEGILTGIPEGEFDSADNTKTLNNTAYIVANFRQTVVTPTTTPTTAPTTTVRRTTTTTIDGFRIINHMMTKDPKAGSGCETPIPTDTFYDYDTAAYCWVYWDNASPTEEVKYEWYRPNGDLHHESSTQATYAWACWHARININAYVPTGNWRVDVYFKGIKKCTEYFTIIGTATTTTVRPTTTTVRPIPTTTTSAKRGLCSALRIYEEDSEEVKLLRYIRDNVLSETPTGRELIKLYYQWSPVVVKAMEEDAELKAEMKELIDEVLGLVGEVE